jgi:hypothetical protein
MALTSPTIFCQRFLDGICQRFLDADLSFSGAAFHRYARASEYGSVEMHHVLQHGMGWKAKVMMERISIRKVVWQGEGRQTQVGLTLEQHCK